MKRLFITTFFPSSNNRENAAVLPTLSTTSYSKSLPSSSSGIDFVAQALKTKGLTDKSLLELIAGDDSSCVLQKLARDLSIPYLQLREYHQHVLATTDNKTKTYTPIRHSSGQACILVSPPRNSSFVSSFMKENYLEEDASQHDESFDDDDDDMTTYANYSSRSAAISISNTSTTTFSSSHHQNDFSSISVKSYGGTITSSIDDHFFDDDESHNRSRSAINTTTTNSSNTPPRMVASSYPKPVTNDKTPISSNFVSSPEEKAKEELQNILGIIHNENEAVPKSALVAAFKKLNDEGRLPSTPFNVMSPIRSATPTSPAMSLFKSIISDVDSETSTLASVIDFDGLLRPSSNGSIYSSSSPSSPYL